MIYLFTGKPRSGKTYNMVQWGYRLLIKNTDMWLWVNRPLGQTLKFGEEIAKRSCMFDELSELNEIIEKMEKMKIKKVLIMIDEGQAYINARKWDTLSEEIQYLMQTHGHYGIDIMITSQHESRIDITVRQLTNYLYKYKKIKIGKWVIMGQTELDTDNMDASEKKKIGWTKIIIHTPWDQSLYDTHAKIVFPKKKNRIEHTFMRCLECGTEKRCG